MSKIQDYFARFEVDGELAWPGDAAQRDKLASDLLGAEIVSSLDYWVNRAMDFIQNSEPSVDHRRKNVAWEREMYIRRGLASLTPEEQRAVIRLVAETASGSLFSALVAFDQCPSVEIRIDAHDLDTSEKVASILPGALDLHDRLYEWTAEFSDDPDRYDPNSPVG